MERWISILCLFQGDLWKLKILTPPPPPKEMRSNYSQVCYSLRNFAPTFSFLISLTFSSSVHCNCLSNSKNDLIFTFRLPTETSFDLKLIILFIRSEINLECFPKKSCFFLLKCSKRFQDLQKKWDVLIRIPLDFFSFWFQTSFSPLSLQSSYSLPVLVFFFISKGRRFSLIFLCLFKYRLFASISPLPYFPFVSFSTSLHSFPSLCISVSLPWTICIPFCFSAPSALPHSSSVSVTFPI